MSPGFAIFVCSWHFRIVILESTHLQRANIVEERGHRFHLDCRFELKCRPGIHWMECFIDNVGVLSETDAIRTLI